LSVCLSPPKGQTNSRPRKSTVYSRMRQSGKGVPRPADRHGTLKEITAAEKWRRVWLMKQELDSLVA